MKNFTFNCNSIDTSPDLIKNAFNKCGVVVIQDFLQQVLIQSLLKEMAAIEQQASSEIKTNWNNQRLVFFSRNCHSQPFIANDYVTQPYFLTSKDAAHIFYENTKNDYIVNRIGHGMHHNAQNKNIYSLVYHNKTLHALLQLLELKKPVCLLSVFIPKFPNGAGSKVRPHQESTFAYTDPPSVMVLWLALEDAMISNACLWGILGSHRFPLKFVSIVDRDKNARHFKQLHSLSIPEFDIASEYYYPFEVKAGSALLFHGNFIHCSTRNTGTQSRKALSFQFIETSGVTYPSSNWIYPPNTNYLY